MTMSFNTHDKIIITIFFGIVACICSILIVCFILWFIIRYYRLRCERMKVTEENNSPPPPIFFYGRQQPHQRPPQRFPSLKVNTNINNNNNNDINKRKKQKRRRYNTNESTLTCTFDPPHLINQNVKNLDKLLHNESTLTANSWNYEETLPKKNYYCRNPSSEPVYASSSTVLTSVSNLPPSLSNSNYAQYRFLNELDQVLRMKQEERIKSSLKHTQSCRQTSDLLPFDYYRSISPPSTPLETNSSNSNSLEPIFTRSNKFSNLSLLRKARLAQLRDDTAILY